MKIHDTEIQDVQFCEGDNIKITTDPESGRVIIAASILNHTRMRNGDFTVEGDCVIVERPNEEFVGAENG